jgi:rod shape-determining protein MreD
MVEYQTKGRWFIVLTFIIALLLDVIPLPGGVAWLRPQWTLLILIYWVMAMPYVVGFAWAFVVGLLLDLLNGSLLGEHAFAMLIVSYLIVRLYQLIRVYPVLQQTCIICVLVLLYRVLIFIIQGIIGELPHTMLYWITVVVSTILWPWLFIVLRDMRRKFCMN